MSIRRLIDTEIQSQSVELIGVIASPFFEYYPDGEEYTFACDVDLRSNDTNHETSNVLRNVPITETGKNDVLRWGQPGSTVVLNRVGHDRYVIVGMSAKKVSNTHVLYVDFSEYIGRVVDSKYTGKTYRALTFEELGLYGGGWGSCPFGASGCWAADGTFLELIY